MQQQKRPLMRKQPSRPIVIAAAPSPVHDDADDLQEVETDLLDDYTSSGFEAGHERGGFAMSVSPDQRGGGAASPPSQAIPPATRKPLAPARKPLSLAAAVAAPVFVPRGGPATGVSSESPRVVGLGVSKEVLASSYPAESQVLMGKNNDFSINYDEPSNRKKVTLSDFEVLKMVGEGAYGRVFQVRHILQRRIYAMKTLKKKFLINSNNVSYTFTERNVLRRVQHPFVVGLHFAFQTKGKVYLVMDFLNGGQIFYHLRRQTMFQEEEVRFYAAEITLALGHLHSLGIVHRDLKPENILLDNQGHVHLTDFGLARDFGATIGQTGTYFEYMAPEMVEGNDYGVEVDWWSMGILLFDMLTGSPPWSDPNEKALCDKILNAKLVLPNYLSPEALRDASKRFAARDVQEHPWFEGMDFHAVLNREVAPPWVPTNINGDLDTINFESKYIQRKVAATSPTDNCDELSKSQNELFTGFSYVRTPPDH